MFFFETRCTLHKPDSINDLGVIFDSNLSFRDHISRKINRAYSILGIIKRNFIYTHETSFILLYKSTIRPYLEHANSVNLFKARLDRFWGNQDVKYDFTADLTRYGDRSVYEIYGT